MIYYLLLSSIKDIMIKDEKCNISIDEYPLINVTFFGTCYHCDCSYSNVSKYKWKDYKMEK